MQESDVTVVRNDGHDRAVVFVHGFQGARDDTWDRFPILLGNATEAWDIYTIGFATTLLPDLVGVWSADPDLPILSTLLCTQLAFRPFDKYKSIALIAHSMGGLVVQKALVDAPSLAERTSHAVLFGTPSAGLRKGWWLSFWKRQIQNMAENSRFITGLRKDWTQLYGVKRPFDFLVVAGASDQFVPPESSLAPFDKPLQRVVPGNHLDIVKPANSAALSVALVAGVLTSGATPPRDVAADLRLAAEQPSQDAPSLVHAVEAKPGNMTVKEIVDAALALDHAGLRDKSIELLQRHQDKDTDVKATLGGRFKRLWFDTDDPAHGGRALALYSEALATARTPGEIYYPAINIAFMELVFRNDLVAARSMAERALRHAAPPGNDVWATATVAEAYLYLGRKDDALQEYQRLLTLEVEEWKHQSTALQASRIAAKLEDRELAEALEKIFTPAARQVNRIFVSYSHRDREWLDRLKKMAAPYLRESEAELDLWEDTRLKAGQQWDKEIRRALARAGVVVALVSSEFLASSYVMDHELPVIIEAANDGELHLLWVHISSALYEVTPLVNFQATHDPTKPLDALPVPEQNEILKSVVKQMKEATLAATARFKKQPVQ